MEIFMKEALKEAQKAYKKREVPIGAVLVKNGKIISRGHNLREKKHDATLHAEMIVIKKACKKIRDFRLLGCEMYVTLEPCLMCAGAIVNARIDKVVFGAYDDKEYVNQEVYQKNNLNHKTVVQGGVLESECKALLQKFFKEKRTCKR